MGGWIYQVRLFRFIKEGIENFSASDPIFQLYNLDKDIGEQENAFEKYPGIGNRLKRLLEEYRMEGCSR